MRNTCHQLLAAFFLPQGLLDRLPQPSGHFIKIRADGGEFILPFVFDAKIQIAISDLVNAIREQGEWMLDPAEHKPDQKPVGQQNSCKYRE